MTLPNIFATITGGTQEPGLNLDTNFNLVGLLGIIPCTAAGTNAITLTQIPSISPNVTVYSNYLCFSFTPAATPTGNVTVQVGALPLLPLYMPGGLAQAGTGAFGTAPLVILYSSALNMGSGGFEIIGGAFAVAQNVWQAVDGSAAAPSFSFANATSTGWYRVTGNRVGLTAGGTQRYELSDSVYSNLELGYRGAPRNEQDGNYTLALSDCGGLLRHNSGSAHAWTIPPVASVAFPIGTVIPVRNIGAGTVTLTRGSGVTLRLAGSGTSKDLAMAQYSAGAIVMEDTNIWYATGVGIS